MPTMSVSINDRRNLLLGNGMLKRLKKIETAEETARRSAAKLAADTMRANIKHSRDIIPVRPGRSSTGGRLAQELKWGLTKTGVRFDVEAADAKAPHWIIQEIGTGHSARLMRGGQPDRTETRSVKRQRGRRLRRGLVFMDASGHYSPVGAGHGQAVQWASRVKGVPATANRPSIRIRNEIRGQHFVKKGGQAGFSQYRTSVLGAARQAFNKSVRP